MSHNLDTVAPLPGGNVAGFMAYVGGTWQSVTLSDAGNGPADSPMASHYHTNSEYGGGGTPYSTTQWATVLGFTNFGRLYLNNSATMVQSTNPPSVTAAAGFPMAVRLPAGEYLAMFTCNDGRVGVATFAEVRPYSTLTNGTGGQFHGHRTRVSAAARFGGLSISRLSFSTTRDLYLRAVTFGGGSGAALFRPNQAISFQIVRLNTV